MADRVIEVSPELSILGDSATLDVGTIDGTVASGGDDRFVLILAPGEDPPEGYTGLIARRVM